MVKVWLSGFSVPPYRACSNHAFNAWFCPEKCSGPVDRRMRPGYAVEKDF